jgi:hypothetical protein
MASWIQILSVINTEQWRHECKSSASSTQNHGVMDADPQRHQNRTMASWMQIIAVMETAAL